MKKYTEPMVKVMEMNANAFCDAVSAEINMTEGGAEAAPFL